MHRDQLAPAVLYKCAVVFDAMLLETYTKSGGRISCVYLFEVTQEQHQRLKAVSALRGQSIKDYVLDDAAEQGLVVNKSVQQIFEETFR